MSLEYCEDCNKNIDTDHDLEHECFRPKDDLKTLKDMREGCEKICCGEGFICEKCLKALAVKWVKHYQYEYDTNHAEFAFMEFFNITEEDLK